MSLAVCTVADVSQGGRRPMEVRRDRVERIRCQLEDETCPLEDRLEWVVEKLIKDLRHMMADPQPASLGGG